MNHNSLIYQGSHAYQIGRRDERMEWAEKIFSTIDKCFTRNGRAEVIGNIYDNPELLTK